MKRLIVVLILIGSSVLLVQQQLVARGPGGGGGGRVGGGAGAARPSAAAARPSPAVGRSPALGGGAASAARPNVGASNLGSNPGTARPNTGNLGANTGANLGSRTNIASNPGSNVGSSIGSNIGAGGRPNISANVGAGTNLGGNINVNNRPAGSQLNNFINNASPSTGAIGAGRGGAAADFLQGQANRPTQLPAGGAIAGERPSTLPAGSPLNGNRPSTLPSGPTANRPVTGSGIGSNIRDNSSQRRQNFTDNRPNRVENRQQVQNNRQQRRDDVRDHIRDNYPRMNFWLNNPNWARWRINAPYRWATWAMLSGWFGWGTAPASTYSYGDNVYYVGDQVYYGNAPVATADAYADQAAAIVASAPQNLDPGASDWMPLGVFAATQDNEPTGADPTLFVQLAVNKSAIISGTFQNMATGEGQTLEGAIDKTSQRAAWGVVGKQWPIVETGVSNLTDDTVPVLVHFADGQTQQWLLVRLEEPKS
jgi:hypothetical protein